MSRIKTGDIVKIISGDHKGTTGKVVAMLPSQNTARIEGVGTRTRKLKPSQLNPTGGSRDIHTPIPLGKLALVVDEKAGKTSRVGYQSDANGKKSRVARQMKNKEIK